MICQWRRERPSLGESIAVGFGVTGVDAMTILISAVAEKMNNVFFLIRTIGVFLKNSNKFFFPNQSRVKHKHMDRLIVRTIKSHALIPNLIRNNK